jgi:hypothetical protein
MKVDYRQSIIFNSNKSSPLTAIIPLSFEIGQSANGLHTLPMPGVLHNQKDTRQLSVHTNFQFYVLLHFLFIALLRNLPTCYYY